MTGITNSRLATMTGSTLTRGPMAGAMTHVSVIQTGHPSSSAYLRRCGRHRRGYTP
jgi:hypothetical protein